MNIFFLIGLVVAIWKIYEFATNSKEKKPSTSPRYQLQDFLDTWDDDWDEMEEDVIPASSKQMNHSFVSHAQTDLEVVEPSFKSNHSIVSDRFRSPSPQQIQAQETGQHRSKRKPKLSSSQVKKAFVYREVLGAPRAVNPYTSKRYPR